MLNNKVALTPEFKKQTTKAIAAIVLFVVTYLLLFLLALGLTAACLYVGIMLIAIKPMFVTIAFGIGLASLGILILVFLLKFLFKSHRVDSTHLLEITASDEPALFEMIHEIVQEVQTSFPKKVYLSSEVNAAVFYDSNFWSMFLPIKKNLQIGVGLVNAVSKAELKAILSHEFGHFSQRTMKVGSYVYNVNQVIYNLIYENEAYDNLARKWSSISGYISIFVVLAVKIVAGIQWVLKKLYNIVNKSYMGLSREMEFHADEIAAQLTGTEPLKSSQLRMNLADHALQSVWTFYEGKIAENTISNNLYPEQRLVMNLIAEEMGLPIRNELPAVTLQEINRFNNSKLVVKDQWASHPSLQERIERLEKLSVAARQQDDSPANLIFVNIEKWQKILTDGAFRALQFAETPVPLSLQDFAEQYQQEHQGNAFPKMYNGYYDSKNPMRFDLQSPRADEPSRTLPQLFSDEMVDLVYTAISLQNDIETLKQIGDKQLDVKTFDYDGKKYKRKDSPVLSAQLESTLSLLNEQIRSNDAAIFHHFLALEKAMGGESKLTRLYQTFFDFDQTFDDRYELYAKMNNDLLFVQYNTPIVQVKMNFSKLKKLEVQLKAVLEALLMEEADSLAMTEEMRAHFELYCSKQWDYFGYEKYMEENLQVLVTALNHYGFLLSRKYFLLKVALLQYQAELTSNATDKPG